MKILLVGGGNMGTALLLGWRKNNISLQITAIDPHPSEALKAMCQAPDQVLTDAAQVSGPFDVVIIAIKPQLFADVLPGLQKFVSTETVFLSIAAGKSLASIAQFFGAGAAIIRAMPNTPALIGQGITVCIANENVNSAQKETANTLLQAAGGVIWIADEELIHAVTALSASGPAYVFAMIEAMQQAGEAVGLSASLALQLAVKTVQGAGALAQHSGKPPAELRQQVTSPNGTTAAGLEILQGKMGLDQLMLKTVKAAARRSRELA